MKEAIERYLRGPGFSRILKSLGIDTKRYWLLMDLFGQLAERREMFSQLGRDGVTLQNAAWLYFVFSALSTLIFLVLRLSLVTYFWIFQGTTAFFLLSILLSETANSLVNPVEGIVLAHQPIDGATYTAAKLTHLLRILLYLVPGLNAVPALAGLLLKGCPWFYPLIHLGTAFAVGLVVALVCCALFGWLIRFVPPPRLKAAGQIAETAPWLTLMTMQFFQHRFRHLHIPNWLPAQAAPRAYLAIAIAAVASAAVVLGIRSLSVDYLVRVSSIVHGGSSAKAKVRRSRLSDAVAWLFGGPGSRAGFEYVARMIVRDYQFRRQMIPAIATLIMPAVALAEGWRITPFSGRFTSMHVLPHTFGVVLFLVCTVLVYGNDHKASWIFLLAPAGVFGPFARGVYAWLWLHAVAIPHLALLVLLAWSWGIRDAALFVAYSASVASAYLSLELKLIDGLPFGKQAETSRNPFMIGAVVLGGIVISIVVGLQYFLVFRWRVMVLMVTLAVAAGAYFVTRNSLHVFEVSIRYHLGLLSTESKGIYYEVDS
ncbi:MAG: hypothetical protein LAQ69_18460 [Acidobacteriia bacterium]|nr:hypothetical protein [Terriglobia bacterium]